jgi:hypothetical protein
MARSLTLDDWAAALRDFQRSAYRLELRESYFEPDDSVARYLAGDPIDPDEVPDFIAWADQIRWLTEAGRTVARVRVHDEPLTPYQRWERWAARQTVAAGEEIRYISRRRARDVGLLPAAGPDDWWLLDDQRLIVMQFDDAGRLVVSHLVDEPERITQARAWWDLAVHHSAPDSTGARLP